MWNAGSVVQVAEHLSNKHKALSSNPSTKKKKKATFGLQTSLPTPALSLLSKVLGKKYPLWQI
jgi:hypothetical protein